MKIKQKEQQPIEKIWNKEYFAYIIIALVAFGLYLPTLSYTFSPLDDEWLIAKRFSLFFKFSSIKIFFSEAMLETYYRPIWISSHLLDVMIGGTNPWIFHFLNAIYHAIASILLYIVFKKLKIKWRVSLLFALIFAIHPINVHAVAFIPGRTDIFLGIFSLSSFIFFINYLEFEKIKYFFFCVLTFTLALFTKESAIVIPLVFISYYILLFQKKHEKKHILFFLLLFIITFIWLLMRHAIIPVYPKVIDGNLLFTIQDALLALLLYIGKILLPINQAVMPTVSETPLLPYILIICFACIIIWRFGFADKKKVLFGMIWFLFFIGLSIIAGSTRNGEHIEQRAYIPLAGILIIISQIDFSKSKLFLWVLYPKLIIVCTLLLLSIKAIVRSQVYANPHVMAQTSIEESPHQAYFYIVLGKTYLVNNMPKEALKWYDKYIEKYPNNPMPYANKGSVYLSIKKFDKAIENYNIAIELDSNDSLLYQNCALAYNLRGCDYSIKKDFTTAIKDFSTAIKLNPNEKKYFFNRGKAYALIGKKDSAYIDFKKAKDMGFVFSRDDISKSKTPEPAENPKR